MAAAPGWRAIDFLSDVHLHPDLPRTRAAWAQHLLHTPADAVFILGDLFEVWVGDDAAGLPFEAGCVQVLQQAAKRRPLYFLAGNRDFLLGRALADATGLQLLADPTVLHAFGDTLLLTHGDALCIEDEDYMRFRAQVRGTAWQVAFLAQPLAQRLAQARAMRDASAMRQAQQAPAQWSDVHAPTAAAWLAAAGCQRMLHGHTHRPGTHTLPGGGTRVVLGDWDLDAPQPRSSVLRWSDQGLQPAPLAAG
jgi:UDP-2,3-diacylglucosamine hydrolase